MYLLEHIPLIFEILGAFGLLLTKVSHIYKHTQMSDCQQIVKMLISIRQNA